MKKIADFFKKLTKKERLYFGLSVLAIALALFIMIFTLCKFVVWLIIAIFALLLAYSVALFLLEFKKEKKLTVK